MSNDNDETINDEVRSQAEYRFNQQRQNSRGTNQNVRMYTTAELQEMLRLYDNEDTRNEAIARATRFLNNLLNKKADFERTAFGSVQQILGTIDPPT